MTSKCLVVVLCQTREARHTGATLIDKLVRPLDADLMLFVSGDEARDDSLDRFAKHIYLLDEPSDWDKAFTDVLGSDGWEELLESGEGGDLLGGSKKQGARGSGGIIMWFRVKLAQLLDSTKSLDSYDWICVVRSDYIWEVGFPELTSLRKDRLYIFQNERYGGYSDRFILFNRLVYPELVHLGDHLFTGAKLVRKDLSDLYSHHGYLNPEMYLKTYIDRFVPAGRIVHIPQLGWGMRSPSGQTRWSIGSFCEELNVWVKYPSELLNTRMAICTFGEKLRFANGQPTGFRFALYRFLSLLGERTRLRAFFWRLLGLVSLSSK